MILLIIIQDERLVYVPNYEDFCLNDEVYCYSEDGLI